MLSFSLLLITVVPVIAGTKACTGGQADIVFLLDSSSSVGYRNFQTSLSFVSTFAQRFPIGPSAVQFSLVVFSGQVHSQFDLSTYSSEEELIQGIHNSKYTNGGTSTDKALEFVRINSYQQSRGGRRGVPRILIVVTDGISVRPSFTEKQASLLHRDGVLVISVGVGKRVEMKELRVLASNDSLVYHVSDFGGLNDILGDLQSAACKQMTDTETCVYAPVVTPYTNAPGCEWPPVVKLLSGPGRSLICGGVLVGRNKVITTAACVDRNEDYSVILGEDDTASRGVTIRVSSTTIHPDYHDKDNDIAVLRLATMVEYNDCIRSACLPSVRQTCEDFSLFTCRFSGWRRNDGRFHQQPYLHISSASLLSPDLCSLLYKYGEGSTIPYNSICIDTLGHGERPTWDDEGGMLSCLVNGTWQLQSLISIPSNNNYPSLGVDLRHPDILNFIKDN